MTDAPPPLKQNVDSELVLVFAPTGRDAHLTLEILKEARIRAATCASVTELSQRILAGAGAALIDERVLNDDAVRQLRDVLRKQGEWSDFPIVLFGASAAPSGSGSGSSAAGRSGENAAPLGNVTFLDRPIQVRSMIAAVHAAIRARRRQYQVRRAIAMREEFLAMLGHELRNPLASVRLAIETMSACADHREWGKQRDVIDRQSMHLARLVDDLLDVARVTHGKVTLQRENIDLVEIVRGCFASQEPVALANDLRYELAGDGLDVPRWVSGDRLRLEQIMNNLLTNAIKYTPRGGSVMVAIVTEQQSRDQDNAEVEVRVTDSGVGIAAEQIGRIFGLFTQADRSLDRSQGGLGLGLTVVQGLVDLHKGKVEARSAGLGHGSEFIVRFPLLINHQPEGKSVMASTKRTSIPPPGGVDPSVRHRVVIVDDNDDLREMLEVLLAAAGHDVTSAIDGPSGVACILEQKPDVAFVDLGLPGFDGFELARRVRVAGQNETVLVAVSGYGQPEDRRRALDAGFDDHLKKPVDYEQLDRALSKGRRNGLAATTTTTTTTKTTSDPKQGKQQGPQGPQGSQGPQGQQDLTDRSITPRPH